MPRTSDAIDVRLLSKVCLLYYNHGLKQQEIADRFQISRPKVSRMLSQAKEEGIVKFSVQFPEGNYVELESKLEKKFGLKEILIVDNLSDSEDAEDAISIKRQLGNEAAMYLHRIISEGNTIGMSWGTTLQAMVDALSPQPVKNAHVIQTLGGVGPAEKKEHAADLCRRLAQLLNAKLSLLPVPGIVSSIEARETLTADKKINALLKSIPKIDILFLGIGALSTNPVLQMKYDEISQDICREILTSEAVGDVALRFFDQHGREVESRLKDLVLGISIDQIRNIDTVVGIAGGSEKFEAILGALNGKLINVLITDKKIAEKLLAV